MILSARDIIAELLDLGLTPSQITLTDETYRCPARSWLTLFAGGLGSRLPPYDPESFDCEDFARLARVYATEANRVANTKPKAAIAFAETEVIGGDKSSYPGECHALNLIRIASSGPAPVATRWLFFEPQTGRETTVEYARQNLLYHRFVRVRL